MTKYKSDLNTQIIIKSNNIAVGAIKSLEVNLESLEITRLILDIISFNRKFDDNILFDIIINDEYKFNNCIFISYTKPIKIDDYLIIDKATVAYI